MTISILIRKCEKTYAVLGLFFALGAFTRPIGLDSNGNAPVQVLWGCLYAIGFLFLLIRRKQLVIFLRSYASHKSILFLLFLAIISFVWAPNGELTLRRSMALVGTTSIAVVLAVRFNQEELFRLLSIALGLAVIISVYVSLALPNIGLYYDGRGIAWQGIFGHKNVMGRAMGLGSIVFFLRALHHRGRGKVVAWGLFGLTLLATLMSRSATSIVAVFSVIMVIPILKSLRLKVTWLIPVSIGLFLMMAVASVVLSMFSDAIFDLLGRNETMTGRTLLWKLATDLISQKPWLGSGYGTEWIGTNPSFALMFLQMGWEPTHAHNGFLQIVLDLGFVGLGLVVASIITYFRYAITLARARFDMINLWPLVFLSYLVISNISQSVLVERNSIFWLLFVLLTVAMHRELKMVKKETLLHSDAVFA